MNNRRSRLSCLSFASALLALLLIFCLMVPTAMAAPSTRENRNTRFGGVYRRPLRGDPSSLDPARATDIYANTVVNQIFDGKEPYAPFLSILAMANAKVVPREEVEKLGEQFGFHPVGSGPFTFLGWERNHRGGRGRRGDSTHPGRI